MRMHSITLGDIAALLNCPPPPNADQRITGIAMLTEAAPDEISLLGAEKYLPQFEKTSAAAVLVSRRSQLPPNAKNVLLVDDAELATAKVLELFAPPIPRPPIGTHQTAIVAPSASIGENARIGPNVVIADDTRIGKNIVLHAGVVIGANVVIGDDCEFFPNVVLRERITIGNRVMIHAGSVLGSDGFGYRWDGKQHVKIPQIGTVIVEDDVEIGSCVCIDRAKFSSTRIGRGTKLDNLVQIGHNSQVGPHCIICGQSALAGSVTLGTGVVLGGQSAVRDHVTMGDGSMLGGCGGAASDVAAKTMVSGVPAIPHRQSLREQSALRRLPELVSQIRQLEKQVAALMKNA
jgi:UDP-3-O-[3-hydroxymyristoyl] glucosamine N-acyltransferase